MALENEYIINVDIKKQFTSRHIAFRRGDNGVIVFRLFDDGEEYNINSATKAVLFQRTPSGMALQSECQFTSIGGKRVIRYEYEEVAMVEIGYNTLVLVIYEGNEAVSLQPFNVTIYDDLQDGADSYLELIQDLMKIIDDLVIDLNNTIKLNEKGVPNGVATLDSNGKIPISQMPNSFQSYINHITETVYLNKVHGIDITTDGIIQYVTPNGNQNVGFAPDATGGGGSGNQVLSATVKVENGIAKVTYSGAPSVNSQKWATGDRNKAYFVTNGNVFDGLEFPIDQVGNYTLWYKDSNNNDYVVLFVVTADQLAPVEINVTVEDGIVSVEIETATQIKKWDKGVRDVPYFQYNGTIFTGNAFNVTEVGNYTVYYKTVNGGEFVYTFEVTEDMLESVQKLVSDLKVNDIVRLYGDEYLVIDSTSTYKKVTLRKAIKTFKSFNKSAQESPNYASYVPDSLASYMNTTYLDSLNRNLKYAITKSDFNITGNNARSELVGLLQIDQYRSKIELLDTSLIGNSPLNSLTVGFYNTTYGYKKTNESWETVSVSNVTNDFYINPTFALRNEVFIDGEALILPELPPINAVFNPNSLNNIRYQQLTEPRIDTPNNVYAVKSGWSASSTVTPSDMLPRSFYNGTWSDVLNSSYDFGIKPTTNIVNVYNHAIVTDINGKETVSVSGAFKYGYNVSSTTALNNLNISDAFIIDGVDGHYVVLEKNVSGGVQVLHVNSSIRRAWTTGLPSQIPDDYDYDNYLPNKPDNIGYYLNNQYYNELPSSLKNVIISRNWGTDFVTESRDSSFDLNRVNLKRLEDRVIVNCKVGLPTYSDLYNANYTGSILNYNSAINSIVAMNQVLQEGSLSGFQNYVSSENIKGGLSTYLYDAFKKSELIYTPSYVIDGGLSVKKLNSY